MTLQHATTRSGLPSGTWKLDEAGSEMSFDVASAYGLVTVRGSFGRASGTLAVDDDAIHARFCIDATSVNTRNTRRDAHLRSPAFFDVSRYPTIEFRPTEIAAAPMGLAITGDLLIGDTKTRIDLPVSVRQGPDRLVLTTSTTISRHATGLDWNVMGTIRGDAKVNLLLTLVREESAHNITARGLEAGKHPEARLSLHNQHAHDRRLIALGGVSSEKELRP